MTQHQNFPTEVIRASTNPSAADLSAQRRAFVADWLKSRQRGVRVVLGGLLALPLLAMDQAEAQTGAMVRADSIQGITNVAVNADGSAAMTLSNGQILTVPAAEVMILADGAVAVSAAAAQSLATAVAAAAGGLAGLGAAGTAAGVAAGAAAIGVAFGGGGDSGPAATVGIQGGDLILNATEVAGNVVFAGNAPNNSQIAVTFNGVTQNVTATPTGTYTATFAPADLPGDGSHVVSVTVQPVNNLGNPVGLPFTITETIIVDTVPPVVAINAIATDDVINIVESGQALSVSGTTDAENGQVVTVTVTGPGGFSATAQGVVVGGAWTVNLGVLAGVPDAAALTFAADVADAAGNDAVQATRIVNTDLTAPTVAIDPVGTADTLTKFNELNGVTVTGTTDAENGQIVTVAFNGNTYNSAPVAGGIWSVTIPAGDIDSLNTGDSLQMTATVSDAAGNPASAAPRTVGVDYSGPSLQINAVAGDDVINIAESGADVTISGTSAGADGETVTVSIVPTGGGAPLFTDTAVIAPGGAWSVDVPQATVAGLADGASFTVTADVNDAQGVAAPQATRPFTTDYTAPTVTITTPISTDGVINIAESTESLTISGTAPGAEDGQIVTVQFGTATQTGPVTGGTWTVTFPAGQVTANVTDGAPTTVTANVSDAAGNPAVASSTTVNVDLTAPTIAINPVGTADTLTKFNELNGVTVTGTTNAEDGQIVTVTFNGNTYLSGPVSAGVWSATIPAGDIDSLNTGDSLQMTATVSDAAGNPASAAPRTVGVDYTGPSVQIAAVAGDNIINIAERDDAGGVTISGTTINVEDGQQVEVDVILDGGGLAPPLFNGLATVTAGVWSILVPQGTIAGLTDGAGYVVLANVSDAGGVAAPQATRPFTTDYTAPTLTLDAPLAGDGIINIAEVAGGFTVSGTTTAEAGQTVSVSLNGTEVATATVQAGGAWSTTVPSGPLGALAHDAVVTIAADVNDAAGNPAAQASNTATVDIQAPTITITAPVAGDNVVNIAEAAAGITVTGTATGADGQTVTLLVNGTPVATDTVAGGTWSATIPSATLQAAGDAATLTITANVADAAGNPASPASATVTTDYSAPTITITTPVAGDNFVNIAEAAAGVIVTGTATGADGQTMTLLVNGTPVDTDTVAGGTWSATIPSATLQAAADGATLTITANVADAAGNPASPASATVTTDYTVPTITMTTPIAGNGFINLADRTDGFDISGTTDAQDGQTVTVLLNGLPAGTGTVAGGAWTVTITPAAMAGITDPDVVTFSANVTDAAGNPSAPGSATGTATVDTIAPSLDFTTPIAGDGVINAAELAAGFTLGGAATGAEDGRIVTVNVTGPGGFTTSTTGTVTAGAWTATLTPAQLVGLPDGATLEFNASVSDLAGNPSSAAPVAVTTDLTPPTIGITTPIAGDDVINAAEQGEILTVSGITTGAENGQTVTVSITGPGGFDIQQTATVTDGAWTATFAAGALTTAPDASTLTITADVNDLAGNPAPQASTTVTTAFTLPTVTIDSHAEDGLVTGTSTGLAAGATVNLSVGTENYTTTVDGAGNWTFQIPKAAAANTFVGLGQVYNTQQTTTASVTDGFGNTGNFAGNVFIYLPAGNTMIETARTGSSATYSVFAATEREGEQVYIEYDPANVTYASFAPDAHFPAFLTASNLSMATGQESRFITAVSPGSPFPDASQPVFTITFNFDGGDSNVPAQYTLKPFNAQLLGGWSELYVGSSGGDSFTAGAMDSVVRGRGGDDTIDLSAGGRNIVIFETTQALNGTDQITGFQPSGAKLPDMIAFADLTNADLRGAGTAFQQLSAGDALGADTGLAVLLTPLADLAAGTIATAAAGLTGEIAGDIIYLGVTDGTDAALARVTFNAVDDASVEILANFVGATDLSGLTATQFYNFV